MAGVRITPGPSNNELLFLEKEHRAYHIFYNQVNDAPLNIRRCDQKFWSTLKNHPIPERVMNYIRVAGFGGVFDCGYKLIDHSLITALVERWRPETHTFHLPIGEATVTLQDVQVLWGLPIEGDVVTGKERKWDYNSASERCVELLGLRPEPRHLRGGHLKATILRQAMETPFPDDASEHACIQRARVYMLYLFGGVIFPDSSDNCVHIYMLNLLEDLSVCSGLSWGSAVLACLYRNLCKATSIEATEISGPLMLLQLWAWCRLPGTSPICPRFEGPDKPYGARWNCSLRFQETPRHTLKVYRSMLHALQENEFLWTPYDDVLPSLPMMCRSGQRSWVCDTFIIFWEIVEEYLPSRVMRQFSFIQTIPTAQISSVADHRRLHGTTRRGVSSKDWGSVHHLYIVRWYHRGEHTINGIFSPVSRTDPGYMDWYWPRTVMFITNPGPGGERSHRFHNLGGNLEIAVDGFSRMHDVMGSMMETDPQSQEYIQPLYTMSEQYLHLTHADDRMQYRPTHVVDANIGVPDFPNRLERLPRRGGRRGGRRRTEVDQPGSSNQGERENSYHGESGPSSFNEAGPSNFSQPGPSSYNDAGPSFQHFDASATTYNYMTPPQQIFAPTQDSSQFGNMFQNCYHVTPPYSENVNREYSPVSPINLSSVSPVPTNFSQFDINLPWEENETQENETQEDEGGRPIRNRRPPRCGTGSRICHDH